MKFCPPEEPLGPSGEPTPARRELPAASWESTGRLPRPEADGGRFVSLPSDSKEEMGRFTPPPLARPPPAAPAPPPGCRQLFPTPPSGALFREPPAAARLSLASGRAPSQKSLATPGQDSKEDLLLPSLHPRVTSSLAPSGRPGWE